MRVFDLSRDTGPPALTVAVTAVIALLFAVVVLATVRGFGFVEVKESHAFYWRH